MKWNVLFFDSLEDVKMTVGYAVKRVMVAELPGKKVAEPPAKKKTETPVKLSLFRKGRRGFSTFPLIVLVHPASL